MTTGKVLEENLIYKILSIVEKIPEGKIATYGQIARLIGRDKNARLVGRVMRMAGYYGQYPCHRVVNHAGRLVPGWREQKALLESEGVAMKDESHVDLKKCWWDCWRRKGKIMREIVKKKPILSCVILFVVCSLARWIEYFVIRTDETVLSENFLHKVFGIAVLAAALHFCGDRWKGIGFAKSRIVPDFMKGLLLGGCCFFAAYSLECMILYKVNRNVSLAFYVSGFSLTGETVRQSGAFFLLLCIVFNLINVWMEEGVFRGFFMKVLSERLSFISAALFIAFLFGIWHLVMPFRDYIQGNASLANALLMGVGYILLAGIMSVKWSLLYKRTGALWAGLGDHFFNNVMVTNLLHVVSNGEADSMQIVRIMIGQILSFFVVCWRCRFLSLTNADK